MNKLKQLVIAPILFVLLPNAIYADCTPEEKKHFSEIEKEYTVSYEYKRDEESYTINLYNPEPDNYDYVLYGSETLRTNCREINKNEATCENLPNVNYYFEIIGITDTCDSTLKEIYLDLSKQNKYWNDPLCEGIEDFVLCQPTYDKEIDYDTFVSRVNTYKKTKQREATKEEEGKKSNGVIDKVTNFLKENLFQIIISVVFVIAIVVTVILTAKSIRKSRRLE